MYFEKNKAAVLSKIASCMLGFIEVAEGLLTNLRQRFNFYINFCKEQAQLSYDWLQEALAQIY